MADIDELLRVAIAERRLTTFVLDSARRIAEPHDYGIIDGVPRLLFYQVGGESRSKRPVGWRWAIISKMFELALLSERFPGARPTPTGQHTRWDKLIASVADPPTKPIVHVSRPKTKRRHT